MSRIKIQHKNIIGKNLCEIRDSLKISQEELAARCQRMGWDIARDTITRIEGLKRLVTDYEIFLLAKALDVIPTSLLPYRVDLREIIPKSSRE